ncbi:50S ribosomal protein L5 [Candidatus Peregrinibacteria bacterium CG_4_9_14_0_2_um_filter_53_11]|nr:MAG: 50S ribosomal protein L5 [Candidatus Peregrinibacteria bacterium CG_4_9_14_0_2_um_filter_53_11]
MSLQQDYNEKIVPALEKSLKTTNAHCIPRLLSVHINVGIGSAVSSGRDPEEIVANIAAITGQKPMISKSTKAISNFKLRINMPVGVTVTLRGARMYGFIDKLVNIVFPRVRDFRGIPLKSFDGNGNYSIGIKEHTVFPEIESEDVSKIHGVQITIKTSAEDDATALELLKALGFPFKKEVVKDAA